MSVHYIQCQCQIVNCQLSLCQLSLLSVKNHRSCNRPVVVCLLDLRPTITIYVQRSLEDAPSSCRWLASMLRSGRWTKWPTGYQVRLEPVSGECVLWTRVTHGYCRRAGPDSGALRTGTA